MFLIFVLDTILEITMARPPRILITTGGTGGHIFPALAVAEELRRACPDVVLLFVGSSHGPEARLAAAAGLDFAGLDVRGVLGRGIRALGALAGMGKAVFAARTLLGRFRPDAAVGFGAYASCAPLVAARLARVPVAVHEQNAVPGVTNRLLSRLAQRIFLSLPDVAGAFPAARCVLTGNPVRAKIIAAGSRLTGASSAVTASGRRPGPRRLLVMGGSQGARAINSLILGALPRLREAGIAIVHQAGPADLDRVRAGYLAYQLDEASGFSVVPFIDDMAAAYADADLVLCRAGASSVAELAACGKPSILIPFPYATHDHQTRNAEVMVKAGAAILLAESDVPTLDAPGLVLKTVHDQAQLESMSRAALACARPDAAASVARAVLEMARG